MGSFSWLRADKTTKRKNLTKGDRYKNTYSKGIWWWIY